MMALRGMYLCWGSELSRETQETDRGNLAAALGQAAAGPALGQKQRDASS